MGGGGARAAVGAARRRPRTIAPSPRDALFAGDPITRAVAADALGRAQVTLTPAARASRVGALLEAMTGDAYPAVRHLAWRALERLGVAAPDYDPSAEAAARAAVVARIRARVATDALAPAPELVARLRARGHGEDIEIGE